MTRRKGTGKALERTRNALERGFDSLTGKKGKAREGVGGFSLSLVSDQASLYYSFAISSHQGHDQLNVPLAFYFNFSTTGQSNRG